METEEDLKYTSFDNLPQLPQNIEEAEKGIAKAFQLPDTEWKSHFESLTLLRSLNKYKPERYLQQVFPTYLKNVVVHVDGLRSKLVKEALILLFETIKYNQLETLNDKTFSLLVECLFKISNSEKGFIKQEARSSILELEQSKNPHIYLQLAAMTLNNNFNISELAILTLKKKVQNQIIHKDNPTFGNFVKLMIGNLNAGRTVLEKTSKEILNLIKAQEGEKGLQAILEGVDLTEEESRLLKGALAEKVVKQKGNFKDFLKQKKGDKEQK